MTMAVGLAACGSSAPPKAIPGPNYATITAPAGRFSVPDNPQRSAYPNACKLLTLDSAQALVGSRVTPGRNPVGCVWTGATASVSTLGIAFVEIGSDASTAFGQVTRKNAASVSGVGGRALLYRLNKNSTVALDVVKGQVFYRVTVTTAVTAPQDLQRIDAIAKRTAQLVSKQLG